MNVKFNKEEQKVPIKSWMPLNEVDEKTADQVMHMANLPFVFKHVALAPDAHGGYGVPIGSIMATKDVVIPHAVGVDIGCGCAYAQFDINADVLHSEVKGKKLGRLIAEEILDKIPVGFDRYDKPQVDKFIEQDFAPDEDYSQAHQDVCSKMRDNNEFETAKKQLGTLGGGNHFIELQKDLDTNNLSLMVHSGSRHYGYSIAKFFNEKAKELNQKWYTSVPGKWDLAFLPINSKYGQSYLNWMNSAVDFARANRKKIKSKAINIIQCVGKEFMGKEPEAQDSFDVNHNYADKEHHFNKNVIVHRKGAIRAREDEMGIVPGAMGSYSYIVKGKGNKQSFRSCSHGAGRRMSRNESKRRYTVEEMEQSLKDDNVYLITPNREDVLDEYKKAYKNVEDVMDNQKDLVDIESKLKTVAVIKG